MKTVNGIKLMTPYVLSDIYYMNVYWEKELRGIKASLEKNEPFVFLEWPQVTRPHNNNHCPPSCKEDNNQTWTCKIMKMNEQCMGWVDLFQHSRSTREYMFTRLKES